MQNGPDPQVATTVHLAFERIRETALRSRGLATWIRSGPLVTETVDPGIYAGTAGIAWALADYAQWSGEIWAADLAREAISRSLLSVGDVQAELRLGFYSGWSGILFVAYHIAGLLDDRSLWKRAEDLYAAVISETPSEEFDIVSGCSGLLVSCNALRELKPESYPTGLRIARHLSQSAALRKRSGVLHASWATKGQRKALHPVGFSHGASGVAWVLLELWTIDRDALWLRDLAVNAMAYEDSLFQPELSNWPDLRQYSTWKSTRLLPPPFQVAWCHGAGGIALTRDRAYVITGEDSYLHAAELASETLRHSLSGAVRLEDLNLCHGTPGNAEMLRILMRRRPTGEDRLLLDSALTQVSRILQSLVGGDGDVRPDPGLMLGVAGAASFLMNGIRNEALSTLFPLHSDFHPDQGQMVMAHRS